MIERSLGLVDLDIDGDIVLIYWYYKENVQDSGKT